MWENRKSSILIKWPYSIISVIVVLIGFVRGVIWAYTSLINGQLDIDGEWIVSDKIARSSYIPYIHDSIVFSIDLISVENEVEGQGENISVNGKLLRSNEKTVIEVSGVIKGDSLHLNLKESGIKRTSTGKFNLRIESENLMTGNFKSTAAKTFGNSTWVKQ